MNHPYKHLEGTALWKAVEAALGELEENRDVKLTTSRQQVVGYFCQRLVAQKLVVDSSVLKE
jgi:hypothetical protein